MKKILWIFIGVMMTGQALATVVESGECGDGCTYTIDDAGNLKITGDGTGKIREEAFYRKRNFTNVDIQGISSIGWMSFYDAGAGGGTVKIDNSVTSINGPFWGDARFSTFDIDSTNFTTNCRDFNVSNITLIIPPQEGKLSWATFTDSAGGSVINNLNIQCKGDIVECAKSMDSALRPLINNNKNLNMTDAQGNTVSWDQNGFSISDAKGNLQATYDRSGNVLLSCVYGSDGSVMTYDKNGKLIDVRGKRILTVDEATALVHGDGKNTFKLKYR